MLEKVFVMLVKCYRVVFSWKHPSCRYIPTCSTYAIEAVTKYGICRGVLLSLKRILRCRPSFKQYSNCGYDPVP